jgi:hypothetical protein
LKSHRCEHIKLIEILNSFYSFKLYSSISVPVALYGCESWSHKLREERRLGEFANRELGRIYGLKRDGVTGERRKANNEELNGLYSSKILLVFGCKYR